MPGLFYSRQLDQASSKQQMDAPTYYWAHSPSKVDPQLFQRSVQHFVSFTVAKPSVVLDVGVLIKCAEWYRCNPRFCGQVLTKLHVVVQKP